jgi:hypothetical protein|tara:strand:- start:178 stop:279 length:102 start_codon:yes stop_codon:yes gene_type:complete
VVVLVVRAIWQDLVLVDLVVDVEDLEVLVEKIM